MLGRLRQALFPEADAGASYETGAIGEEQLAASLNPLVEAGTIEALHDRRIPRSSANIDHLVVAASGIWVVDAKRYRNKRIAKDVPGGMFNNRAVLSVDGRTSTKLVEGVQKQIGVVRTALTAAGLEHIPLHGALCFIDGDWGIWRMRPFSIDGVVVSWPRALRDRLSEAGDLDREARVHLIEALGRALPPAG